MKMEQLKILARDMNERTKCRNYYKKLRDAMSLENVNLKSEMICSRVLCSKEYESTNTIFAYYPLGKEVNCIPVLQQALKDGKRVVLPRTGSEGQMDFYEISVLTDVIEGTFHVMEPRKDCQLWIPPSNMTENILVLVPGVVFDREGNRYGYGKGYYDRYFARFPGLKRMALAYTEQISKKILESLTTDIKMHAILTESERIDIK